MNESVLKRNVIFLLVLIVVALAVRLWASQEASALVGPMSLRMGPFGKVYTICNDRLYIHSQDSRLVEAVPLERFGMSKYIDDFWVFENGDILFRKEISRRPLFRRILEAIFRGGSRLQDSVVANQSTLQRCSMKEYACTGIEEGGDHLQKIGILRMYVDEAQDNLYISDNFGNEVLLLDLSGRLQRKSGKLFKFPNHLQMGDDGHLYVADAEHHRIAAIKAGRRDFGAFAREFKIKGGKAGKVYPVTLAQTLRGDWWVVAAGITMQHGALTIFSREGDFQKEVGLPDAADPYAILPLADSVLVSDPTLMDIYAIDLDGTVRDRFGSMEFKKDLLELAIRRDQYEAVGKLSLGVLIGGLVIALLIARFQSTAREKKPGAGEHAGASQRYEAAGHGALNNRKYDYHSLVRVVKVLAYGAAVLMAAVMLLLFATPAADHLPASFHLVILVTFFVAMQAMIVVYVQMKNSSIECSDEGIRFSMGKKTIFSSWHGIQEIRIINRGVYRVYTENGKFPLGRIEPADGPTYDWVKAIGGGDSRPAEELVEEIKRRAPQAKVTRSFLVKISAAK